MTKRTTVEASMARPLAEWRLCPECVQVLELERQAVGIAGCAVAYCPHNGMHGTWISATLQLQPCASLDEARGIDAGLEAFLAQVQARMATAPNTGGGKPS